MTPVPTLRASILARHKHELAAVRAVLAPHYSKSRLASWSTIRQRILDSPISDFSIWGSCLTIPRIALVREMAKVEEGSLLTPAQILEAGGLEKILAEQQPNFSYAAGILQHSVGGGPFTTWADLSRTIESVERMPEWGGGQGARESLRYDLDEELDRLITDMVIIETLLR